MQKQRNFFLTRLFLCLVALLTTTTAWGYDNVINGLNAQDDDGIYHFHLMQNTNYLLELTAADVEKAGTTGFKVYDVGGKNQNYRADGHNDYLVIHAPEGYVLQLSGTVTTEYYVFSTEPEYYLSVYDNEGASGNCLVYKATSLYSGSPFTISPVVSTGRYMTLNFKTLPDSKDTYEGLDLTVKLIPVNKTSAVTVNGLANGNAMTATIGESPAATAKVNDEVTLTATPASGYLLSNLSVKDADNNAVPMLTDMLWYAGTNTGTFRMPASNVTVTPTFTNILTAQGGLYINMPVADTKTATIPEGVQSFKVYDDGGAAGQYRHNCNGYLVMNAPKGYVLQLSGSINIGNQNGYDWVDVYDGNQTTCTKLINKVASDKNGAWNNIKTVTSSGSSMMIYFHGSRYPSDGLDLTVTLISTNEAHDIHIGASDNGNSMAASIGENSVTAAKLNDVVTLTATPAEGFVLTGISVTDDSNNEPIAVTWDIWSNTATFTMPASTVTVTPTFSNNQEYFSSIMLPVTGTKRAVFPTGVQSIKVYDNGGPTPAGGKYDSNVINSYYSSNCDGSLVLTAPEGYQIRLSGTVQTYGAGEANTAGKDDYMTVYDGTADAGTKLLDKYRSYGEPKKNIDAVISTQGSMTIYFHSGSTAGSFDEHEGLDLTATLVNATQSLGITVNANANGTVVASVGGSIATKAYVNDVVTLTATNLTEGYFLNDVTVTYGDNQSVSVNWDEWHKSFWFTMPEGAVTVTPVFSNDLENNNSIIIPKKGVINATFPTGIESVKVYDDHVITGSTHYSTNYNGYLVMTAPEGYVLKVSGSLETYPWTDSGDYLTIYDGSDNNATPLLNEFHTFGSNGGKFSDMISTGRTLTFYFYSDNDLYKGEGGLDLTVTLIESQLSGSGSEDDPVLISTADHWNSFCENLSNKKTYSGLIVKLGADIRVSSMAGANNNNNAFAGTFDGAGHTLTFNYGNADSPANEDYVAPFCCINNATIKNLHVKGYIYTSGTYAGGIVGTTRSLDESHIVNCRSSINIVNCVDGYKRHGGIMGRFLGNNINIEGCVFDGSISSAESKFTNSGCGFVGDDWYNTLNISNSLMTGDISTYFSVAFLNSDNLTVTNSFYTTTCNLNQGIHATTLAIADTKGMKPVATYDVSGITVYENALMRNGTLYHEANQPVTMDYSRVIPAGTDACTVCLPYTPPTTGLKYYTLSSINGMTLQFTEVETPAANTPYLVVATTDDANVGAEDAAVDFAAEIQNPEAVVDPENGTYYFKGTLTGLDHEASEGKFVLQSNNTWGQVTTDYTAVYIPPFRAYIEMPEDQFARQLNSELGDATTGINSMRTIDRDGTEQWFDLGGHRISKPTRQGVYIYKGKKVKK